MKLYLSELFFFSKIVQIRKKYELYNMRILHRSRDYKAFFMLKSTERDISTALRKEVLIHKHMTCFVESLRCCI